MPIEIKELVIRATIGGGGGGGRPKGTKMKEEDAREEIVAECVEQVMKILHMQRER